MAALLRRQTTSQALCQCQRAFSTSAPRAVSLQWDKNHPEALKDALPEYPYGPTRWYKQSAKGLYGGQRVQFGNNVSEKFKTKTRRRWNPNIVTKRLWSSALNRYVQIRVTTRVLRTIDKLGGLDEYLLGEKEMRIRELGESGWWLRWAIMQTPAIKKRFRDERAALGLPEDPEMTEAVEEGVEVSSAEEDAEEIETEPVVLDDTFKIEHNPDLPPLKFRVEPRKHVMLTDKGWVRTRPSKERWVNMAKDRIANSHMFATWKSDRVQKVKDKLEKEQERANKPRYDKLTRKISRLQHLERFRLEGGELGRLLEMIEDIQRRRLINLLNLEEYDELQRQIKEVISLQASDMKAARAQRQSLERWLASVFTNHEEANSPTDADDEFNTKTHRDEDVEANINTIKAKIRDEKYDRAWKRTHERNSQAIQSLKLELKRMGAPDVILTEKEQGRVLEHVKKALTKEFTKRVTMKYEHEKMQHDEGVMARRIARKAKKAAIEGGQGVNETAAA